MDHSIIEKLRRELQLPIRRESQVLYIMAEVRKYLEYDEGTGKDFGELNFFCNWALHVTITHRRNAPHIRAFLKPFDMKPGMSIEEYLESNFYQQIMQLEILRLELKRFFAKFSLPDIVSGHNAWSAFVYLYTSIISEVPLEYTKGDLLPAEVLRVEITRLSPLPSHAQGLTRWQITLKNGKSFASSTLYGTLRDEHNNIIHLPNFWDESFQL